MRMPGVVRRRQVFVQLEDLECPRELLDTLHRLQLLIANLALQHNHVRVVSLQLNCLQQVGRHHAVDIPLLLQSIEG
ncbi:hypothetical protein D3C81_1966410 [compost metagenome]